MSAFVIVLLLGLAFIGWQLYQKKKVVAPVEPVAPPVVPAPVVVTPAPVITTPVLAPAVTPAPPNPGTAVDVTYYTPPGDQVDRHGKVLRMNPSGAASWLFVDGPQCTFYIPAAFGSLQLEVAGGQGDVAITLKDSAGTVVANADGANGANLYYKASGDYTAVVQVGTPSGQTINRYGA